MSDAVLALNSGSSSIKFAVAALEGSSLPRRLLAGKIEEIDHAPRMVTRDGSGQVLSEYSWPETSLPSYEVLLEKLLRTVDAGLEGMKLAAVGHRVVHGGRDFGAPMRVSPALLEELQRLSPLAPLHQPHNLAPIRALLMAHPALPQVACFDTAFHHSLPAVATRFALPRAYEAAGLRRYGFHGLSYEYIAGKLAELAPELAIGRVVVAHLGSGASLCALQGGRSVETTMGFTALDGLMMGTRCGSIDPGVLLYLQQQKGLSAPELERVLYQQSGLLGVSVLSSDMRSLLASPDPAAREAVELFCYRAAREIAALAGVMGGLDGVVFTAGIGERAAPVRAAICSRLSWLGAVLDTEANEASASVISTSASRVALRVIPTDEEAMIYRHTIAHLADQIPEPGRAPGAGTCLPPTKDLWRV